MDWLIWIVIGGVLGWLASLLMKTDKQMGILANVLVGIVGSILGGWLAPKLGIAPTGAMGGYLVALGGAVLLILVLRLLGIFK
jgi:uncharacterized membrane protein YeaQ/YmgE (transglycosylase-associated protein family)